MPKKVAVSFPIRQRKNASPSGGKLLESQIPSFSLENFLRAPNAEEFIKKQYFAAARSIVRDLNNNKNGTSSADLSSIDAVIARSLKFTKQEIREWMASRDWSRVEGNRNIENLKQVLAEKLPELATRKNPFDAEESQQLIDKVILLISDEHDPIADFIQTSLKTDRRGPTLAQLGF